MRDGRRPDGSFISRSYPSYRGMTDGDLNDLWDYLRTLPAVAGPIAVTRSPGHFPGVA